MMVVEIGKQVRLLEPSPRTQNWVRLRLAVLAHQDAEGEAREA